MNLPNFDKITIAQEFIGCHCQKLTEIKERKRKREDNFNIIKSFRDTRIITSWVNERERERKEKKKKVEKNAYDDHTATLNGQMDGSME